MEVNPLFTGDIESSLNFFDGKLRSGDTIPEYVSVLKIPTQQAKKSVLMGRDFTKIYPRSSHYDPSMEEPIQDDRKAFMQKYFKESGYSNNGFDTDLKNLDLTPRAFGMFQSFDSFRGAFNNIKLTGDMIKCLLNADKDALMAMFMNWGPPQLVKVVMFVKSAIMIHKTKINSFRDALLGLILPILIKPLLTVFLYTDQLMSLTYNTAMDFANILKSSQNAFCQLENNTNTTLANASEYITEEANSMLSWYTDSKNDIERSISVNSNQINEAALVIQKVAVTKKIVDIIMDTMG